MNDATRFAMAAGTAALGLVLWSPDARADYAVTCESKGNRYQTCPLRQAGYVTLRRQKSSDDCRKGRNWDFNRREIWVDDGCRAEFNVDTGSYGHSGSGSHSSGSSDGARIAGALVGLAIIGAAVHEANKDKDDGYRADDRYNDDNYYGSRHSSYVPHWMVGHFEGYNPLYHAPVQMDIDAEGRMTGSSQGERFSGWVNDGRLHVGNYQFELSQTFEGLVTSQVGNRDNEVRYRRVR